MSILQKPHVQLMLYRRLAVLAAAAPAAWPCGCASGSALFRLEAPTHGGQELASAGLRQLHRRLAPFQQPLRWSFTSIIIPCGKRHRQLDCRPSSSVCYLALRVKAAVALALGQASLLQCPIIMAAADSVQAASHRDQLAA